MNKIMRTFGIAAFVVLTLTLFHAGASAQTSKLSPGDQKIAQALFEAQSTSEPLTREQIVAMKSHEGWGDVFKDMKSKGLLKQKNLGQIVSEFERRHPETAKIDAKPDKSDKPDKADKPDKPGKPERMDRPERPERPGR